MLRLKDDIDYIHGNDLPLYKLRRELRYYRIGMNYFECVNYKKILKYTDYPLTFNFDDPVWWRWYSDFYGFHFDRVSRSYFLYVTMNLKFNVCLHLSFFIKMPNKYEKHNQQLKKRAWLYKNSLIINVPEFILKNNYKKYNNLFFNYLNFMFPAFRFLTNKSKTILDSKYTDHNRQMEINGDFGQDLDVFFSTFNHRWNNVHDYRSFFYNFSRMPRNYTMVINTHFMSTSIIANWYDSDILVYPENYIKFKRNNLKNNKLIYILNLFNLNFNLKFFYNIIIFYCSIYLKIFFYKLNKVFFSYYSKELDYYKINLYFFYLRYIYNNLLQYNKWYLYIIYIFRYNISNIFLFKNYTFINNLENIYINSLGFYNNLTYLNYFSKLKNNYKYEYFLKFVNKFNFIINLDNKSKNYYYKKYNYFFIIYLFNLYNKKSYLEGMFSSFSLYNINKLYYNIYISKFIINFKYKLIINSNHLFKFYYILKPSLIFEKFINFFYIKRLNMYSNYNLFTSGNFSSKNFVNYGYLISKQNFKFMYYKYHSNILLENLLEFIYIFSDIIMSNFKLNFRFFIFINEDSSLNNIYIEYSVIIRYFLKKFLYFLKKIFKINIYTNSLKYFNLKFNIYEKIFFSYIKFYKFNIAKKYLKYRLKKLNNLR